MTDIDSIITQLERQREAIDNALEALRGVAGPAPRGPGRPRGSGAKRSSSAGISEGRQRQIEAMRAYWAARKSGGKKSTGRAATKKRGLTEAGRKRLAENMRKRWAAKRAGR